jgi:hypothetical protein
MSTANGIPNGPITSALRRLGIVAAFLLLFLAVGSTALAIDQPPETASQQRAWLLSHLVTDMQSVGSFTSDDIARTVTLVNSLTDDQVGLLARFYFLTREKTEQDAQLYAVQQTGTEQALAEAKAQVAGLLAQLQNQIQQTYSELATVSPGCQTLCQVAYASVPGWCAYNQYAIPDWYYGNGCYVGPACSAGYCGLYAVPVYNAFYNRGSRYNFWNRGTYVHNNLARIGRKTFYNPAVSGAVGPHPATRNGAVTVNRIVPPALKHKTASLAVNHAPAAVARQNSVKLHHPATVAKTHAAACVASGKRANHVKSHTVAHHRAKAAAHPKAHRQAHAKSHPQHAAHVQHVARAASHPGHAAGAHSSSGHSRHR